VRNSVRYFTKIVSKNEYKLVINVYLEQQETISLTEYFFCTEIFSSEGARFGDAKSLGKKSERKVQ